MDLLLALAGAAAGALAMALPGAHVNGLALAALLLWPAGSAGAAPFLVGALAGAPFGAAVSATLFGASDESAFPAHALAREGRAAEAIALQAWGAFAGALAAAALAVAAWPLARALSPRLADAIPWLLLGVVALLVLTEPARPAVHPRVVVQPWGRNATEVEWSTGPLSRPAGMLLALAALALSGALGAVALRMGARSPLGVPASPLLPLLAGLFAAPTLVGALRERARTPRASLRAPAPRLREVRRAALPAAAASSLLGLAPGVSGAHVALLARRPRGPEEVLLSLGAIGGGAAVFTVLAWHALGKARAGALVAAGAFAPPAPGLDGLLRALALVVAAAGAACLLARAASAPLSRALARMGGRRVALAGALLLAAGVVAATGAWGAAVFAAAALVGSAVAAAGVRRSLAMGAILVPALLRAWGLA